MARHLAQLGRALGNGEDTLKPPTRHVGQAEQAQGFRRRRGVHDQHVKLTLFHVLVDPEQVRALFQAGQNRHFFGDDLVDTLLAEQGRQVALDFSPVFVHRIAGVHFLRPQIRVDFDRLGTDFALK